MYNSEKNPGIMKIFDYSSRIFTTLFSSIYVHTKQELNKIMTIPLILNMCIIT